MSPRPTARLASVNLFARDLDRLTAFYAGLFDFAELTEQRSPIYRALDAGGATLAFHAHAAYALLHLETHTAASGVRSMLTIDVAERGMVDRLSTEALARGARQAQAPRETTYGSRQSVLFDPDGNVFRINAF